MLHSSISLTFRPHPGGRHPISWSFILGLRWPVRLALLSSQLLPFSLALWVQVWVPSVPCCWVLPPLPPLSISAALEQMSLSVLVSWSGGNASAARAGNPEQAVWNPLALRRKLGGKGTHPWACHSCLSIWEPGVPVLLTQT